MIFSHYYLQTCIQMHTVTCYIRKSILSVNEKILISDYRKRNLDRNAFRVFGLQQTHLEQLNHYSGPVTREQLVHMHFVCFFMVYQKLKTLFSETIMPMYA